MIISEQQREDNFQEYLLLLKNPDYCSVTFDSESGGYSAVHKRHCFDPKIGIYGIKKGDYELITANILRARGHAIVLESEDAPDGVRCADGTIDGIIMDIKAIEGHGKWAIKDKFHDATKKSVECVILYFHKMDTFSMARIEDGWQKFLADKDSQRYAKTIRKVTCIVEEQVFDWEIPI